VILDLDPLTGKELYTFYCDPTLAAPNILVVHNTTTVRRLSLSSSCRLTQLPQGSRVSALPVVSTDMTNTVDNTVFQFSVEYKVGQRNPPYGSLERLYTVSLAHRSSRGP
jgi:hypothetical protein